MQLSELLRAAAAQGSMYMLHEDGTKDPVVVMSTTHIAEIEELERKAHEVEALETEVKRLRNLQQKLAKYCRCECELQFCDHWHEAMGFMNAQEEA